MELKPIGSSTGLNDVLPLMNKHKLSGKLPEKDHKIVGVIVMTPPTQPRTIIYPKVDVIHAPPQPTTVTIVKHPDEKTDDGLDKIR